MSIDLSAAEKAMANLNVADFEKQAKEAQQKLATALSPQDVKTQICDIWKKVRAIVKVAEAVPFIGKYVVIFADLMDSICGSGTRA